MIHICDKLNIYIDLIIIIIFPTKAKINAWVWKDTPSIESLLVSRAKCFFLIRQLRATEGNMLPVSQIFSMPTKYLRFGDLTKRLYFTSANDVCASLDLTFQFSASSDLLLSDGKVCIAPRRFLSLESTTFVNWERLRHVVL